MSAYLKAINPAIVGIVGVLGYYIANGDLDKAGLAVAVVTAIQATGAYFIANVPGWDALKALVPPLLTNIGVLGLWIETGAFDRVEVAALVTSVVLGLVTYLSTNR